mgnify:CR=1 FL=1
MVEDRLEVAVVEAAGRGGRCQGLLDRLGADQGGQVGGAGHLGPDALGARRRGGDEPALGATAELTEGALLGGLRPRAGMERVAGALGIVGGIDPRAAGRGEPVAGDLCGASFTGVGDHQLVAGDPYPDPLADKLMGHAVPR